MPNVERTKPTRPHRHSNHYFSLIRGVWLADLECNMTVYELKKLLDEFDGSLEVRFDMDSADYYDHRFSEDPIIDRGQYVEDGATETYVPPKQQQRKAESAYLLLKA